MERAKYRGGGGMVFWQIDGDCNPEPIVQAAETAGLQERPFLRTPLNALKASLEALSEKGVMVRPLAKKDGYSQVRETVGDEENDYDSLATIKVVDEALELVHGDCDLEAVRTEYGKRLGHYSREAVAGYLGRVVLALGGTALRPGGAIYWIPETALDRFRICGEGVEAAGANKVYLLTLEHDAELVRSVGDAIVAEVTAAADQIDREIDSKELGDRAVKNRIETAKALAGKVRDYENALQITLQPLVDRLLQIETACAILNVQASNVDD